MTKTLSLGILIALALSGCAEDPEVERRGSRPEPSPMPDGSAGAPSDGSGGAAPDGSAPFCAALGVIRAKCQRCHGDPLRNGAPAPFLTYEDTQAPYYVSKTVKWSDKMLGAVESDFMPYVALNDSPMPPMPPVEPLSEEEKLTLLGWLEAGALPTGGTDCP